MDNGYSPLRFRSTRVASARGEADGVLVFVEQELAAVLVKKQGAGDERWDVEASFGELTRKGTSFSTLDSAKRFFSEHLMLVSSACVAPLLDVLGPLFLL